ncbi:hypothetical protein MJ904_19390 [Massilia sp. MB5]|uniref:hypothetical protein n=1 Tax=Massilia sp. MB5 TaxID=2919578 RepID=UPI001F0D9713|nr:hypothetical protein [Massilia sp. MB5]UMR33467.1 hypothetical protein MJ904_19390 [Massilia sp. MB5]
MAARADGGNYGLQQNAFRSSSAQPFGHMRDREHPLDYKGGLDPDDYKDWLEEYPLSGYVPQALAAFKTVARQIDKIETEQ